VNYKENNGSTLSSSLLNPNSPRKKRELQRNTCSTLYSTLPNPNSPRKKANCKDIPAAPYLQLFLTPI
jgi:hypothetical protein